MLRFFKPDIDKLKKRGDVKGLERVLQSRREFPVRHNAAVALAELGHAGGMSFLLESLASGDDYVRLISASLAALGKEEAIEPILGKLCESKDLDQIQWLTDALSRLDHGENSLFNRTRSKLVSVLGKYKSLAYLPAALKMSMRGSDFRILYEPAKGHYVEVPQPLCEICRTGDSYPEGSCWGSCDCHKPVQQWISDAPEKIELTEIR